MGKRFTKVRKHRRKGKLVKAHARRVNTRKKTRKIKTSKRNFGMAFSTKTTIPLFDNPESFGKNIKAERVEISPREFLGLAQKTSRDEKSQEEPLDDYIRKNVFPSRDSERAKKALADGILTPKELTDWQSAESKSARSIEKGILDTKPVVPLPFIEFKNGIPIDHEGRHRASVAQDLGLKKIPVLFVEER